MVGPEWFLPCASIANIGKNVGFLAASASRAAIHQSLSLGGSSPQLERSEPETCTNAASPMTSVSSNLGDVTAKSGSQSIVASLLGTVIGIFLSQTFCADYGTAGILVGFVVLSAVHQTCTYKAVKVVPLRSLDRHRLHIVLRRRGRGIQIRSLHSIGMVWSEEEGEIQFECMLVIYYNYDLLSKVRSTYTYKNHKILFPRNYHLVFCIL